MPIGPGRYIILGLPGNKVNGETAPELGKLVDSGTIRILDRVFITKDAASNSPSSGHHLGRSPTRRPDEEARRAAERPRGRRRSPTAISN